MKKSGCLLVLVCLTIVPVFASADTASTTGRLSLKFFGSATCDECMRIKQELLWPLAAQYREGIDLQIYDTESDSGIRSLIALEKSYKMSTSASQVLFFSDTFLTGFDDIMKFGRDMIVAHTSRPSGTGLAIGTPADSVDLGKELRTRALNWGFFFGTLATGLVDGINPCAIATMIFLISFLATRKRSRNEILLIGLTYTTTVFLTYLAMGLGLKGLLEQIRGYHLISSIIRWGACTAAVIVAVLSFKDAFVYHRSGRAEEITLQLPKAVKLRIHKIISGNLGRGSLLIGSAVTGFLVTLLEAICTGQMYIPYIVAMTQQESLRLTGYLYLIFYNFLFVLPLLIVMILAYYGLKWNDLAKQTQKRMVAIKIIFGSIMVGLAIYLAIGSGFVG
jgi:cytochrome c biogenesis protein CcdA